MPASVSVNDPPAPSSIHSWKVCKSHPPSSPGADQLKVQVVDVVEVTTKGDNCEGAVHALKSLTVDSLPSPLKFKTDRVKPYV